MNKTNLRLIHFIIVSLLLDDHGVQHCEPCCNSALVATRILCPDEQSALLIRYNLPIFGGNTPKQPKLTDRVDIFEVSAFFE